jgi:response regulator RpfG family c-di-GMP phosphodiesterase
MKIDKSAFLAEAEEMDVVKHILEVIEEINSFNDIDAILDRILLEARKLTNADAGTIFLVHKGSLEFVYVHNETLFQIDSNNRYIYSRQQIPINKDSIVGYVASTGETLVIDDAYNIPDSRPFGFNFSFDEKTGYRSKSMFALPLKSFQDKVVGVIQLINAQDKNGNVTTFNQLHQTYVPLFASKAASAIERGRLTRDFVLRMMKMAELHDPKETGAHVQRVGAYAAEIYHRWALNNGVDIAEMKKNKDLLRLAAMLHDVGKMGVSDLVLKKKGKLDADEFEKIKCHTIFGGRMFADPSTELDRTALEVALNHHEKWAGGGYPGYIQDLEDSNLQFGPGKSGYDIPLNARVTALADVYDALVSNRIYKDAWPEEKVLDLIRKDSGISFDPEVVRAFFDIYDVIEAIRDKYQD